MFPFRRALALALIAFVALALTACGPADSDDAATAQGTSVSHDEVTQVASVLRAVGALQQAPCGQVEGEGDTIEAACDRISLGLLVQFALAESYAAENGVTVSDADLQAAADQFSDGVGRAELEDALATNGATYDDFTTVLRRSLLQREVSRALVVEEVGEDGLREEYDRTPTEHTIVQVDHILVETEDEANEIYDRMTAPGATRDDFLQLASEVSIDPSAAQNSGSLGSTPASEFVPEFAEAAVALEPGEIAEPVETEFGWHVIRLEDAQVTPYDEARDQLLEDRAGVAFAGWMRERVGDITVNPRYGRLDPETLRVMRVTEHRPVRLAIAERDGGGRAGGMSADRTEWSSDGPVPTSRGGDGLLDLVRVQARLRAADGCPWDREQTHATLARHLLEETHELLQAIDDGDDDAMRDELGDLLLQVTFHAQIAAEDGRWDIDDVADGLVRKLVHRHPHVFGDAEVADAGEVLVNWERLKAEETGGRRAVDDEIPASLPALARAAKVQRRAAGWGFAWPSSAHALAKVREELDELAAADGTDDAEEELGDVLLAVVAVARSMGLDAETALRRATSKFAARYEATAALAASRGLALDDLTPDELLALYDEARSRS